jgi:hypothetical protein
MSVKNVSPVPSTSAVFLYALLLDAGFDFAFFTGGLPVLF